MRAYGLSVQAESLALPGGGRAQAADALATIQVRLTDAGRVRAAWSGDGPAGAVAERVVGGRRVVTSRGAAGDVLIEWNGAGIFHLDAVGTTLLSAAGDGTAPGDGEGGPAVADVPGAEWQRFLLDTVLATAALRHGAEALHAGAVAIGGGVVAIAALTGGGKSSLVAELMARGHHLVADDVLALRRGASGEVLAEPAPAVLTLEADRPFGPAPTTLGRELARVGSELWIEARYSAPGPLPLCCCAFLKRGPGLELAAGPLRDGARMLLGNALVSGLAPARQAQRLDFFADLAQTTRLLSLDAPLDAPPAAIADTLEAAVAGRADGTPRY